MDMLDNPGGVVHMPTPPTLVDHKGTPYGPDALRLPHGQLAGKIKCTLPGCYLIWLRASPQPPDHGGLVDAQLLGDCTAAEALQGHQAGAGPLVFAG